MGIEDKITEYLLKEGKAVKNAPLVFTLLVFLAFGAAFILVSWHYSERINLLTEEINEYKNKLDGYSPDAAAKIINAFKSSLQRHLTPEQKSRLEIASKKYCPNVGLILIEFEAPDKEAAHYADDFLKVFMKAGCKVTTAEFEGSSPTTNIPGLIIGAIEEKKDSDNIKEFDNIISETGLIAKHIRINKETNPYAENFIFFIGEKPEEQ